MSKKMEMMSDKADMQSQARALSTQPVWIGFSTGAEALGQKSNVLLHAGPAFASPEHITAPIMNSACVASVYEGLAKDFDTAEAMIQCGEILLCPAQDFGVVTPLAAVVSASMPLHKVKDMTEGQVVACSPINAGSRPAMRLGLRSIEVLEHIRWLNTVVRDVFLDGIGSGISLVPLAAVGLANGDDCHGNTKNATRALIAEMDRRSPDVGIEDNVRDFMVSSPSLFLNLWMAATKCMMLRAEGVEGSSFITAAGGNGRDVGIQISGASGQWVNIPADPPKGSFDVDVPEDRAMGAVGDSAVVEAFGLGAMTPKIDPEVENGFKIPTVDDVASRTEGDTVASSPYFNALAGTLGHSARQFVELGNGPQVGLGILDRLGQAGRLGGGLYSMPKTPFELALKSLSA